MPSPSTFLPSAQAHLLSELTEELKSLQAQGLLRGLTEIEGVSGPYVRIKGCKFVCWCSNDYLGLAAHARLARKVSEVASAYGVGARASRLLAGTTSWHIQLEERLAEWFGTEGAIVFASGYLANLGALGTLLRADDAVFVDRLCHASLIEAARATRAQLRVFRHNDPSHLAQLLEHTAHDVRRRIIVTEGVFSMDGDRSTLSEIVEVAERNGALVYLDDAHGAFVLGASGRGSPEESGISHERLLYMATLGKALGCQGGFIAGPRQLIDALRNRSKTFMYATALAVPVAAAGCEALQVVRDEPWRVHVLRQRAAFMHEKLKSALRSVQGRGIIPELPARGSHILPVVIGETARAMQAAQRLREQGIWAPAIRPPTVPKGSARLRFSITSEHTEEHIETLAYALGRCWDA